MGRLLADELRQGGGGPVALVVSPALGGLIIGHEVARALGARHIFTERDPASGKMILRRGFAVATRRACGGGGRRNYHRRHHQGRDRRGARAGAVVLAAGSIVDRSGGRADVGVPRVSLLTLQVAAHYPEDCPLCRQGIPAVKPGSRPV